MAVPGSDLPEAGRPRPGIREILRPRPDEEAERSGIPAAALMIGPTLVIAGIATTFFIPPVAFVLLILGPGVLSLAWLPGGSATLARRVAIATAIVLGLAVGALGLLANRCAADPAVVGVAGAAFAIVTFLVAVGAGRAAAMGGQRVTAVLAAGAVAFVGLGATLYFVISNVFVLC